jgi:hypothetical protein
MWGVYPQIGVYTPQWGYNPTMVVYPENGGHTLDLGVYPPYRKTSHIGEDFHVWGDFPISREYHHVWGDCPYMGRLPIYWETPHIWGVSRYMGSLPTRAPRCTVDAGNTSMYFLVFYIFGPLNGLPGPGSTKIWFYMEHALYMWSQVQISPSLKPIRGHVLIQ